MRRPAFQFYPADWRNDAALRMCSLAARGLWIDMLCIMHAAEPYGHLVAGGEPINAEDLARIVGDSTPTVSRLLGELSRRKVYSVTSEGVIYSRRMIRDEGERDTWRIRQARHRNVTPDVTASVTGDLTRVSRRSSSSSSSSTSTPPLPPSADADGGPNGHDLLGGQARPAKRQRGKRDLPAEIPLPADWEPDDSAMAWTQERLRERGLSDAWAWEQLDSMRDYARQHPAWLHADWSATWRNWVRKALERRAQ